MFWWTSRHVSGNTLATDDVSALLASRRDDARRRLPHPPLRSVGPATKSPRAGGPAWRHARAGVTSAGPAAAALGFGGSRSG